ncbi:hypothetical protein BDW02DRAFT_605629 [Decorospora gaudefroyi]|uniref:Uncharacterized protein n=1 Tax=Decorospora gaudefroyi TaxID=184978 RepID=A0A6A5KRX0_9PLEO|nr:hypothetical protein BDW02DRAFT_605629 [Decorospora gaudefroyi]
MLTYGSKKGDGWWQDRCSDAKEESITGEKVEGVRLKCIGYQILSVVAPKRYSPEPDRYLMHGAKYPAAMGNSGSEIEILLADKIGVPLVVKEVAPSLAWRDRKTIHGHPCRKHITATVLHMSSADFAIPARAIPLAAPSQTEVFEANRRHSEDMETWDVVRKDGGPLDVLLFLAMLEYFLKKKDKFIEKIPINFPGARNEEFLRTVLKADYQKFYAMYAPSNQRMNISPSFHEHVHESSVTILEPLERAGNRTRYGGASGELDFQLDPVPTVLQDHYMSSPKKAPASSKRH